MFYIYKKLIKDWSKIDVINEMKKNTLMCNVHSEFNLFSKHIQAEAVLNDKSLTVLTIT